MTWEDEGRRYGFNRYLENHLGQEMIDLLISQNSEVPKIWIDLLFQFFLVVAMKW